MFTTTISVSSIYNTSRVVIVPVFWLYIIIVVDVISFSIVVSCVFISLMFVSSGMMYLSAGDVISAIRIILLDGESISFHASLVVYINSTSIPPVMIMKRTYENQSLLYMVPPIRHVIVVCRSRIIPMASGCFICVNIILGIILIDISSFVMSGYFI
jgi:hypothetical protein